MSIVVAKVGSSSLVEPDGGVREAVIDQLVADLAEAAREGHHPVLVTSGAIACGYRPLGFTGRPRALPDLQAASAVGQGILFARYRQAFASHGLVPAQILLTSNDLAGRATYLNARNTLNRLLDLGVVPVINENDTTATDEVTFGDNDVLAAQVAILVKASWLVLLTDREGLYGAGDDGSPFLIHEVPADVAPEDVPLAVLVGSGVGRGGVNSKIASAAMAVGSGITAVVASGARPGVVCAVTRDEQVGTRFHPASRREPAFKLWLRHAKPTRGQLHIDPGAAQALRMRGTSLLAVGITEARGDFAPGDAVEVRGPVGETVGKGIVSLSRQEVNKVAGLSSHGIAERGLRIPSEVIHRDRFVLAGR